MVFEFSCTKCGRLLRGGEGSAGNRVLCAKCGTFNEVPDRETPVDDEPRPDTPDDASSEESFPPPAEAGTVFGEKDDGDDIYGFADPQQPREEEPTPVPSPAESGSPFATAQQFPQTAANPYVSWPDSSHQALTDNPYQSPTEYSNETPQWSQTSSEDQLAVVSLVLGICGFFLGCCCPPLGAIPGVAAIVTGVKGLNGRNRGFAVAGIVLGSIQILWALLYLVLGLLGSLG